MTKIKSEKVRIKNVGYRPIHIGGLVLKPLEEGEIGMSKKEIEKYIGDGLTIEIKQKKEKLGGNK